MILPVSWLFEAAVLDDSSASFAKKMTEAGNAVEGISTLGEEISGVVVGKIQTLTKHPDADKLWVAQTDIGSEVLQIVTGADNLKVGDYIPVAVHGATLANGLKIKKSKMRGLESNGMLCSLPELGLSVLDFPHATEDGILVFHELDLEKFPLGSDAKTALNINEEIIDFDVLSNRPDTNSLIGMAREACAVYGKVFHEPKVTVNGKIKSDYEVKVRILDENLCRRFIVRIVENVKIAPSPDWMRRRLMSCGVRPINNIVDITNYVMLEYGQPLHAFDINAVKRNENRINITIRTSNAGETFTTLDGIERPLPKNALLVTDEEKPIGIAGVMGGENSMITEGTKTILFESANFNPQNIRVTARKLGLRTEASARFEKGLDPNQSIISMNRAMELIELLCCGSVTEVLVDEYPAKAEAFAVNFSTKKICERLGLALPDEEIFCYLKRAGIKINGNRAEIPTYRKDITCEADLSEEVARFYGYNNIPSRYMQYVDGTLALPSAGIPEEKRRVQELKRIAAGLGYYEAITYPFESEKIFDKLNLPPEHIDRQNAIRIENPLNEEFGIMRASSAIGSLLGALSKNISSGNKNVRLFETLYVYESNTPKLTEMPRERHKLVLACYGDTIDFFTFKGDISVILTKFADMGQVFLPQEDEPYLHPTRAASIKIRSTREPSSELISLGIMGEVHPLVCRNFEIGVRAYAAVLDISNLHKAAKLPKKKVTEPFMFPPLDRDLAFIVKEDVLALEIEAAIWQKGGGLLNEVELFDVYQGEQINEGYKSMAYSLRFRDKKGTLTADDVKMPLEYIIKNLEVKFEAEVRR